MQRVVVIMGLIGLLFGRYAAAGTIQDAVDLQMQPLWTSVNGTAFDSDSDLNAKQKRIDELKAWAMTTQDQSIREAQLHWISVAQYTINHEREERAKKRNASKIVPSLPPLPNLSE